MTGGQLLRKTSQNTTTSVSIFQRALIREALQHLVILEKGLPHLKEDLCIYQPAFSLRLLALVSQFMPSD